MNWISDGSWVPVVTLSYSLGQLFIVAIYDFDEEVASLDYFLLNSSWTIRVRARLH